MSGVSKCRPGSWTVSRFQAPKPTRLRVKLLPARAMGANLLWGLPSHNPIRRSRTCCLATREAIVTEEQDEQDLADSDETPEPAGSSQRMSESS